MTSMEISRRDALKGGLALFAAALLPTLPAMPVAATNPLGADLGFIARPGELLGLAQWDGGRWTVPYGDHARGHEEIRDAEVIILRQDDPLNWTTADGSVWTIETAGWLRCG
jgi:hypothetical protein